MRLQKGNPVIPNMSIANAINVMSMFYRNSIAVDSLDLKVSYQKLINDTKIISKSLKELGIQKNDIITISMPNYYQSIVIFMAANRIGALTTFLNYACCEDEIINYLNLFESPLLVNYNKDKEYNSRIKSNTKVKHVITLRDFDLNRIKFNESSNFNIGYNDNISYCDLKLIANYYKHIINPYQGGKQDALILFTSGSTGKPKSVILTNENIMASGIYMKNTGHVETNVGEKLLVCIPFCYPYGFVTSVLMSLLCGRNAVLTPNLNGNNVSYYLSKNPNYIFGSPALLELIKRNIPTNQDLSSVHSFVTGGDFLSPEQYRSGKEFFQKHNAQTEIYNGFGNAEASGAISIAVGSKVRHETVGKILMGSSAIIVDPNTLEVKEPGEEGMLCISGKHIFKEYYKEPKLTSKIKFMYKGREYIKTGTLGKLTNDGYFILIGRMSRFFITADLNKVYLEHIQKFINNIDIVKECAVVPKPDENNLYVSKVYIVLKDNIQYNENTKEYIVAKCQSSIKDSYSGEILYLKDFEQPSSYTFLLELPKTIAGKIDFKLLEEMAIVEAKEEKGKVLKKVLK